MANIDGLVRFRAWVQKQSHAMDVKNAHRGLGMYLGIVIAPAPDLSVRVAGAINYTDDEFILSVSEGTLLVPRNIRVTIGDVVSLLPMAGGNKWFIGWVTDVDQSVQANQARVGFNGDNTTPGAFVGIEVDVPDGDVAGTGSVSITGETIHITSFGNASVVIDGINFKGHTHTDPQGGNSGAPH